ncbi:hypothetical protein TNCV_1077621 [Trichonephila clavipes]|uniref:Uncharacterized protein n=1 Tax=Trichonephila clavipes TaxID=2585209 RepID=A0A8X6RL55_TRICX|nr:hypothetical protein TNCV_1077621 [Trichonephila clavipes]
MTSTVMKRRVERSEWSAEILRGRGSLVVKGTDLWPAGHEFEPSTAVDPQRRGGRCTLNLSRLKRPPIRVIWKSGKGGASSGVVLIT